MKKTDFFQLIQEKSGTFGNISALTVDGKGTGSRFFFSGDRFFAENEEEALSPEEKNILLSLKKSGPISLGDRTVFAEILQEKPHLVICGGGHVAQQVILLAKRIGFFVTVLEDRPAFANAARTAGADEVLCDDFQKSLHQIPRSDSAYFLVVTRGHRYDGVCLSEILKKPHAYVGMMASRGRAALLKKQLEAEGSNPKALEAVHTPVGLSIHAETPEEIAVSIAAELIQVKNTDRKTEGYESFLPYLTGEKEPDKGKVLATIITRRGSAPRGIGTKMLVLEDGRLIGTLGGGCMEAEIRGKCLHMLRDQAVPDHMETADLTGAQAEEEGLVCGGRIEVFLERVNSN